MTQQAGFPLPAGRGQPEARRRRVVGKAQLAVSAAGTLISLSMVASGRWLEAVTVFLLTLGLLEILMQRALTLFHGGTRPRTTGRHAAGGKTARPATAAE